MKKILAMLLALMMVLSLAACGGSEAAPEAEAPEADAPAEAPADFTGEELKFTTGGSQGTYYGFGSVLAGQITSSTDSTITAVEGAGSQANIELLDSGDMDVAFVQSDVMAYAYDGQRLFDGAAIKDFSVVAALYMEAVQIVTNNPEIKTVADLKGKKVSVGAAGSGTYFNAIDALEAYGMTESDISPVYQSFGDSTESLKDGKIDAAFVVAGAPTTSIVDLATATDVYLVNIDGAECDAMLAASPYYSTYVIPAGTY